MEDRDELAVHAPQLDLAVIRARDNEGQRGVEGGPVDTPIVALQHILHNRIPAAEQVRIHLQEVKQTQEVKQ